MIWNKDKEKKDKLPDLPATHSPIILPNERKPFELHRPPEDIEEIHQLPTFPDDSNKRGFSQMAIKEAISDSEREGFDTIESEEDEWKPQLTPTSEQETSNTSEIINPRPLQEANLIEEEKTGIFVKINKFQQARKNLRDAKIKLDDINSVLDKIKATKSQEDEELKSWESQILTLKSRLKNISEEIFEDTEWHQNS